MFTEETTEPAPPFVPPQRLPADDPLMDELTELGAHVNAGLCKWLDLVAELEERGLWAEPGFHSCAHWISFRCGVSRWEAREHVRVAKRLRDLPVIQAAFARGEVSYAKVRTLTRVAEPSCEEELLELAALLTVSQLERALGVYRRITREEAAESHERAFLYYFWDDDGSLLLRARLPAEDGAVFVRALEAARDSLRERRRGEQQTNDDPIAAAAGRQWSQPPGPTSAEALTALAEAALTAEPRERTGGERVQVTVHIDAGALADDAKGRSGVENGPALSPETARRLGCDSSLVRIIERDGKPLSVGRRTRTIPPALRRALKTRDRCCQFPGCDNDRFVDAHHIEHWAHGGATELSNLILLCRYHHRLLHEGGARVERSADGALKFFAPAGWQIRPVQPSPRGDPDELVDRNHRRELTIDPDTCRNGSGERMDLDLAVNAVSQIIERGHRKAAAESAEARAGPEADP
jgi:Domain of unknown function (DUF222)/HNH endonuclease